MSTQPPPLFSPALRAKYPFLAAEETNTYFLRRREARAVFPGPGGFLRRWWWLVLAAILIPALTLLTIPPAGTWSALYVTACVAGLLAWGGISPPEEARDVLQLLPAGQVTIDLWMAGLNGRDIAEARLLEDFTGVARRESLGRGRLAITLLAFGALCLWVGRHIPGLQGFLGPAVAASLTLLLATFYRIGCVLGEAQAVGSAESLVASWDVATPALRSARTISTGDWKGYCLPLWVIGSGMATGALSLLSGSLGGLARSSPVPCGIIVACLSSPLLLLLFRPDPAHTCTRVEELLQRAGPSFDLHVREHLLHDPDARRMG